MTDPTPASRPTPNAGNVDSEMLQVLMDTLPDRIYFKDLESRFVRNNPAHARSLGAASPEACVGKTDFDFFSREHAQRARADEAEIIRTGVPVVQKIERLTLRDGKAGWASTTKMPWRDREGRIIGTFGLTRDITASKEAEDRLREERNLLRTIIDHLPSRLYVKDLNSRYVLNNRAHLEILGAGSQADAVGRTTIDFFPGERGEQALADDRAVLDQSAAIVNQEKSNFGEEQDLQWSLVTKVPLHDTSGKLIGLVGISHDITRRKLAEAELQRRTGEMETDLKMARQIQEAFLNRPYPLFASHAGPGQSALRFAHRYLPASTLGGDFFDFVRLSDTHCGILVCDVMGHGVRAGLLTALVRGVVEEVGKRSANPSDVLAEINLALLPIVEQTGQPVFATAFFGVVDLTANRLVYANAGHPAPLVLTQKATKLSRLAPANPEPATGLLEGFRYSVGEHEFSPGDVVLGYTDGVLEASDHSGHLFGEERMRDLLVACRGLSGEEVCNRVLVEIARHSGRGDFEDDVCLVCVERLD